MAVQNGRPLNLKLYVLILLFSVLPILQFSINDLREDIIPTKNVYLSLTPGEFAGTLMLGGFRGLAVDLLWIRAEHLKLEKRFFELVAISDMIMRLQPHDRMVWEYNAWNRAYNISYEITEPEEKWKWIKSGIELNMRGIERMPESWKLKHHLGWMFFQKGADFPEQTKRDFGEDNFTLAREYFKKALRQNPDAPLYIDRLVIHTYERQGDFETARKLYEKHLEKYPNDRTARQNLDTFLKERVRYRKNQEKLLKEYAKGNYASVVEIYEDDLRDDPYLMPADVIEAIQMSYIEGEEVEKAMGFIQSKMNLKMEDPQRTYRLYETLSVRYNLYFNEQFKKLREKGDNEGILALYREKIKKKNVDISLENGIIVLESMLKTGAKDDARDLLVDLERQFPGDLRLVPFKGTVNDNNQSSAK